MSDFYHFVNSLRDLLRPRRLVAAGILIGLAVLLAVIQRYKSPSGEFDPAAIYNGLSSSLIFGFILVILSVVFTTGLIAQETEQKTISYLLTRPVPRWRILLPKFLAAVVVTTVIVWLTAILVAIIVYGFKGIPQSRLGRDMLILPVGVLAYSALFLFVSTLLNRPLIYGLVYAFGWESWVPSLPGDWQKLSLMAYLHALAPHLSDAAEAAGDTPAISMPLAWGVLLGVIVVGLIAALMVFSVREYVPREDTT